MHRVSEEKFFLVPRMSTFLPESVVLGMDVRNACAPKCVGKLSHFALTVEVRNTRTNQVFCSQAAFRAYEGIDCLS